VYESTLRLGKTGGILRRTKCISRTPWYHVADTEVPDAFLTYVNSYAPRIVVNGARSCCTNALHRLWWLGESLRKRNEVVALASLTSLAALSAELVGRNYGGGALKLEPREAASIKLPIADISTRIKRACREAKEAWVAGNFEVARRIADNAVLSGELGVGRKDIGAMELAARVLRLRRLGARARADR